MDLSTINLPAKDDMSADESFAVYDREWEKAKQQRHMHMLGGGFFEKISDSLIVRYHQVMVFFVLHTGEDHNDTDSSMNSGGERGENSSDYSFPFRARLLFSMVFVIDGV